MFKSNLIFTVFVTLAFNAFSQEDVWDVYLAEHEKGTGSTLVNMSLKDTAPMLRLPYLLTTGVSLNICNPHGLPEKEEFNTLYQISDTVKAALNTRLRAVAAGTFYSCAVVSGGVICWGANDAGQLAVSLSFRGPRRRHRDLARYARCARCTERRGRSRDARA